MNKQQSSIQGQTSTKEEEQQKENLIKEGYRQPLQGLQSFDRLYYQSDNFYGKDVSEIKTNSSEATVKQMLKNPVEKIIVSTKEMVPGDSNTKLIEGIILQDSQNNQKTIGNYSTLHYSLNQVAGDRNDQEITYVSTKGMTGVTVQGTTNLIENIQFQINYQAIDLIGDDSIDNEKTDLVINGMSKVKFLQEQEKEEYPADNIDRVNNDMEFDTPDEVEYLTKIRGRADHKSIKSIQLITNYQNNSIFVGEPERPIYCQNEDCQKKNGVKKPLVVTQFVNTKYSKAQEEFQVEGSQAKPWNLMAFHCQRCKSENGKAQNIEYVHCDCCDDKIIEEYKQEAARNYELFTKEIRKNKLESEEYKKLTTDDAKKKFQKEIDEKYQRDNFKAYVKIQKKLKIFNYCRTCAYQETAVNDYEYTEQFIDKHYNLQMFKGASDPVTLRINNCLPKIDNLIIGYYKGLQNQFKKSYLVENKKFYFKIGCENASEDNKNSFGIGLGICKVSLISEQNDTFNTQIHRAKQAKLEDDKKKSKLKNTGGNFKQSERIIQLYSYETCPEKLELTMDHGFYMINSKKYTYSESVKEENHKLNKDISIKTGDIIQCEIDSENKKLTFSKYVDPSAIKQEDQKTDKKNNKKNQQQQNDNFTVTLNISGIDDISQYYPCCALSRESDIVQIAETPEQIKNQAEGYPYEICHLKKLPEGKEYENIIYKEDEDEYDELQLYSQITDLEIHCNFNKEKNIRTIQSICGVWFFRNPVPNKGESQNEFLFTKDEYITKYSVFYDESFIRGISFYTNLRNQAEFGYYSEFQFVEDREKPQITDKKVKSDEIEEDPVNETQKTDKDEANLLPVLQKISIKEIKRKDIVLQQPAEDQQQVVPHYLQGFVAIFNKYTNSLHALNFIFSEEILPSMYKEKKIEFTWDINDKFSHPHIKHVGDGKVECINSEKKDRFCVMKQPLSDSKKYIFQFKINKMNFNVDDICVGICQSRYQLNPTKTKYIFSESNKQKDIKLMEHNSEIRIDISGEKTQQKSNFFSKKSLGKVYLQRIITIEKYVDPKKLLQKDDNKEKQLNPLARQQEKNIIYEFTFYVKKMNKDNKDIGIGFLHMNKAKNINFQIPDNLESVKDLGHMITGEGTGLCANEKGFIQTAFKFEEGDKIQMQYDYNSNEITILNIKDPKGLKHVFSKVSNAYDFIPCVLLADKEDQVHLINSKEIHVDQNLEFEGSQINHGAYMIRANGFMYSNHDETVNDKQSLNMKFKQGDIVEVEVNPFANTVNFINRTSALETSQKINLVYTKNKPFYPCITLNQNNNHQQVQFLTSDTLPMMITNEIVGFCFDEDLRHKQLQYSKNFLDNQEAYIKTQLTFKEDLKDLQFDQYRVNLLSPCIQNNKRYQIQFKVLQSNGRHDAMAFGLCIKKKIKSKKYQFDSQTKEHGCYMVSNSGTIYSHHNEEINNDKCNFEFQEKDIITVEINPDIDQYLVKKYLYEQKKEWDIKHNEEKIFNKQKKVYETKEKEKKKPMPELVVGTVSVHNQRTNDIYTQIFSYEKDSKTHYIAAATTPDCLIEVIDARDVTDKIYSYFKKGKWEAWTVGRGSLNFVQTFVTLGLSLILGLYDEISDWYYFLVPEVKKEEKIKNMIQFFLFFQLTIQLISWALLIGQSKQSRSKHNMDQEEEMRGKKGLLQGIYVTVKVLVYNAFWATIYAITSIHYAIILTILIQLKICPFVIHQLMVRYNKVVMSSTVQKNMSQELLNDETSKKKHNSTVIRENLSQPVKFDMNLEKSMITFLYYADLKSYVIIMDTVEAIFQAAPMAILQYYNNTTDGNDNSGFMVQFGFYSSVVSIMRYAVILIGFLFKDKVESVFQLTTDSIALKKENKELKDAFQIGREVNIGTYQELLTFSHVEKEAYGQIRVIKINLADNPTYADMFPGVIEVIVNKFREYGVVIESKIIDFSGCGIDTNDQLIELNRVLDNITPNGIQMWGNLEEKTESHQSQLEKLEFYKEEERLKQQLLQQNLELPPGLDQEVDPKQIALKDDVSSRGGDDKQQLINKHQLSKISQFNQKEEVVQDDLESLGIKSQIGDRPGTGQSQQSRRSGRRGSVRRGSRKMSVNKAGKEVQVQLNETVFKNNVLSQLESEANTFDSQSPNRILIIYEVKEKEIDDIEEKEEENKLLAIKRNSMAKIQDSQIKDELNSPIRSPKLKGTKSNLQAQQFLFSKIMSSGIKKPHFSDTFLSHDSKQSLEGNDLDKSNQKKKEKKNIKIMNLTFDDEDQFRRTLLYVLFTFQHEASELIINPKIYVDTEYQFLENKTRQVVEYFAYDKTHQEKSNPVEMMFNQEFPPKFVETFTYNIEQWRKLSQYKIFSLRYTQDDIIKNKLKVEEEQFKGEHFLSQMEFDFQNKELAKSEIKEKKTQFMIDNNYQNIQFFKYLKYLDLSVKLKKNVGIQTLYLEQYKEFVDSLLNKLQENQDLEHLHLSFGEVEEGYDNEVKQKIEERYNPRLKQSLQQNKTVNVSLGFLEPKKKGQQRKEGNKQNALAQGDPKNDDEILEIQLKLHELVHYWDTQINALTDEHKFKPALKNDNIKIKELSQNRQIYGDVKFGVSELEKGKSQIQSTIKKDKNKKKKDQAQKGYAFALMEPVIEKFIDKEAEAQQLQSGNKVMKKAKQFKNKVANSKIMPFHSKKNQKNQVEEEEYKYFPEVYSFDICSLDPKNKLCIGIKEQEHVEEKQKISKTDKVKNLVGAKSSKKKLSQVTPNNDGLKNYITKDLRDCNAKFFLVQANGVVYNKKDKQQDGTYAQCTGFGGNFSKTFKHKQIVYSKDYEQKSITVKNDPENQGNGYKFCQVEMGHCFFNKAKYTMKVKINKLSDKDSVFLGIFQDSKVNDIIKQDFSYLQNLSIWGFDSYGQKYANNSKDQTDFQIKKNNTVVLQAYFRQEQKHYLEAYIEGKENETFIIELPITPVADDRTNFKFCAFLKNENDDIEIIDMIDQELNDQNIYKNIKFGTSQKKNKEITDIQFQQQEQIIKLGGDQKQEEELRKKNNEQIEKLQKEISIATFAEMNSFKYEEDTILITVDLKKRLITFLNKSTQKVFQMEVDNKDYYICGVLTSHKDSIKFIPEKYIDYLSYDYKKDEQKLKEKIDKQAQDIRDLELLDLKDEQDIQQKKDVLQNLYSEQSALQEKYNNNESVKKLNEMKTKKQLAEKVDDFESHTLYQQWNLLIEKQKELKSLLLEKPSEEDDKYYQHIGKHLELKRQAMNKNKDNQGANDDQETQNLLDDNNNQEERYKKKGIDEFIKKIEDEYTSHYKKKLDVKEYQTFIKQFQESHYIEIFDTKIKNVENDITEKINQIETSTGVITKISSYIQKYREHLDTFQLQVYDKNPFKRLISLGTINQQQEIDQYLEFIRVILQNNKKIKHFTFVLGHHVVKVDQEVEIIKKQIDEYNKELDECTDPDRQEELRQMIQDREGQISQLEQFKDEEDNIQKMKEDKERQKLLNAFSKSKETMEKQIKELKIEVANKEKQHGGITKKLKGQIDKQNKQIKELQAKVKQGGNAKGQVKGAHGGGAGNYDTLMEVLEYECKEKKHQIKYEFFKDQIRKFIITGQNTQRPQTNPKGVVNSLHYNSIQRKIIDNFGFSVITETDAQKYDYIVDKLKLMCTKSKVPLLIDKKDAGKAQMEFSTLNMQDTDGNDIAITYQDGMLFVYVNNKLTDIKSFSYDTEALILTLKNGSEIKLTQEQVNDIIGTIKQMINQSNQKYQFVQDGKNIDLKDIDIKFQDKLNRMIEYVYDNGYIRRFTNGKYEGDILQIKIKEGMLIDPYGEVKMYSMDQQEIFEKLKQFTQMSDMQLIEQFMNLAWVDEKYTMKFQEEKNKEYERSINDLQGLKKQAKRNEEKEQALENRIRKMKQDIEFYNKKVSETIEIANNVADKQMQKQKKEEEKKKKLQEELDKQYYTKPIGQLQEMKVGLAEQNKQAQQQQEQYTQKQVILLQSEVNELKRKLKEFEQKEKTNVQIQGNQGDTGDNLDD